MAIGIIYDQYNLRNLPQKDLNKIALYPVIRGAWMEETLASIEIIKDNDSYKAKIQSGLGRYVEYENEDFENLLQQVYEDIQEELGSTI